MTTDQKNHVFAQTITNGGVTVNASDGTPYTGTGYAVAVGPQCYLARSGGGYPQWAFSLLVDNAMRSNPEYIGTWVDGNKLYVEPTRIVESMGEAVALAKEHKQIAFYDFVAQRSIRLTEVADLVESES